MDWLPETLCKIGVDKPNISTTMYWIVTPPIVTPVYSSCLLFDYTQDDELRLFWPARPSLKVHLHIDEKSLILQYGAF
jgi:hypothetical protein